MTASTRPALATEVGVTSRGGPPLRRLHEQRRRGTVQDCGEAGHQLYRRRAIGGALVEGSLHEGQQPGGNTGEVGLLVNDLVEQPRRLALAEGGRRRQVNVMQLAHENTSAGEPTYLVPLAWSGDM